MRRFSVIAIAVSATVALSAVPAWAASIELDRSFSGDGVASADPAGYQYNLGVAADGNAVYAFGGTATNWNDVSKAQVVRRYLPGGRPDPDFGRDGVKTLRYTDLAGATGGDVTANGALIVTGWTDNGLSVTKVRSNGSLDHDFGQRGVVRMSVKKGASRPRVVVSPDGSLVLAWTKVTDWQPFRGKLQIARLRADGARIRNFGNNGIKTVDLGLSTEFDDLTVSRTGQVFIGADIRQRGGDFTMAAIGLKANDRLWIKRLNPYGRDSTISRGVSVDDQDRPLFGITPYDGPGIGVVRLTTEGTLDTTYAGDGIATHRCTCYTTDSVFTAEGVLVQGGTYDSERTTVSRFLPNGRFDRGFAGGEYSRSLAPGIEYVAGTAIDQSGRLILGGQFGRKTGGAMVARLLLD